MTSAENLVALVPDGSQPRVAVQKTSLGIDVLGRFLCNTFDEAIQTGGRPFDAVILGSGMFGSYCADKLSRNGLRVLVLEAGPFLVPQHLQNFPNLGLFEPGKTLPSSAQTNPPTPRNQVWGIPWSSETEFVGLAFCVGGKSPYWGGWCPKLQDDDLSDWPSSTVKYLKDNYPLLEQQLGVDVRTDFIQGPLYNAIFAKAKAKLSQPLTAVEEPPLAVQGQSPASGLFSFDKYSSVSLLCEALRDDAARSGSDDQRNLFLVPNAHVTRLITNQSIVTEIEVSVNGVLRRLPLAESASVVLAMSGIESTRLALLSLPRQDGLALAGRNLMAHLRSNTYFRVKRSVFEKQTPLPKNLQTAAFLVRGGTPDGKFHFQVTASADENPQQTGAGDSDRLLYAMIPDIDVLQKILDMQKSDWISFAVRGCAQKQGDKVNPVPNPSGNWINISPFEADEYDVPRAFIQLSVSDQESRLWDAMDKATIDFANALADNDPNNIQFTSNISDHSVRDGLGTTYHEAGTLWMGSDPSASVTDGNGHFHHITNAFCVDQALFPSVGSVNPVLTGLTLTRNVSEKISSRVVSHTLPVPAGSQILFDGSPQSIVDWRATNDRAITNFGNVLEVRDGPLAILYYAKHKFKNFVLQVEWKYFSLFCNSGVFLRMPEPPINLVGNDPYYKTAIEIQIDETGKDFDATRNPQSIYGSSLHKTGAIYGLVPASCWAATAPSQDGEDGFWNQYVITANGDQITVRLNDLLICQGTTNILNEGYIGLQYHTDRVQFRNLAITEL